MLVACLFIIFFFFASIFVFDSRSKCIIFFHWTFSFNVHRTLLESYHHIFLTNYFRFQFTQTIELMKKQNACRWLMISHWERFFLLSRRDPFPIDLSRLTFWIMMTMIRMKYGDEKNQRPKGWERLIINKCWRWASNRAASSASSRLIGSQVNETHTHT